MFLAWIKFIYLKLTFETFYFDLFGTYRGIPTPSCCNNGGGGGGGKPLCAGHLYILE